MNFFNSTRIYNLNNKYFAKEFMAYNERLGNIAPEQGGSRKGHQAPLVALNAVLTHDILRQNKQVNLKAVITNHFSLQHISP